MIWYLKQKGVDGVAGKINYPKLKKILEIFLDPEDEEEIKRILREIAAIEASLLPPSVNKMKICKSCSYHDICWV